ncbi:MAG TPA: cytochrome c oxidase subunit 3 [Thermoanaerobaculia bacterium]|nr:cytochrome c oxidase subunit 3 [Thermoanaerobaculia bacterium]
MKQRPVIDVSELPSVVFGSRAPIWWGVVGLVTIESMGFALLAAAYFYLRGGASEWPPPGVINPPLALTTTALLVLLASSFCMHEAAKAAKRAELGRILRWLIATAGLGYVFLVLRGFEFASMSYEWRSHAYGSIVWVIVGIHTLHILTSAVEKTIFIVLFIRGPVEDKHLTDVATNEVYWHFVSLSWLVFYVILYLEPGFFRP